MCQIMANKSPLPFFFKICDILLMFAPFQLCLSIILNVNFNKDIIRMLNMHVLEVYLHYGVEVVGGVWGVSVGGGSQSVASPHTGT